MESLTYDVNSRSNKGETETPDLMQSEYGLNKSQVSQFENESQTYRSMMSSQLYSEDGSLFLTGVGTQEYDESKRVYRSSASLISVNPLKQLQKENKKLRLRLKLMNKQLSDNIAQISQASDQRPRSSSTRSAIEVWNEQTRTCEKQIKMLQKEKRMYQRKLQKISQTDYMSKVKGYLAQQSKRIKLLRSEIRELKDEQHDRQKVMPSIDPAIQSEAFVRVKNLNDELEILHEKIMQREKKSAALKSAFTKAKQKERELAPRHNKLKTILKSEKSHVGIDKKNTKKQQARQDQYSSLQHQLEVANRSEKSFMSKFRSTEQMLKKQIRQQTTDKEGLQMMLKKLEAQVEDQRLIVQDLVSRSTSVTPRLRNEKHSRLGQDMQKSTSVPRLGLSQTQSFVARSVSTRHYHAIQPVEPIDEIGESFISQSSAASNSASPARIPSSPQEYRQSSKNSQADPEEIFNKKNEDTEIVTGRNNENKPNDQTDHKIVQKQDIQQSQLSDIPLEAPKTDAQQFKHSSSSPLFTSQKSIQQAYKAYKDHSPSRIQTFTNRISPTNQAESEGTVSNAYLAESRRKHPDIVDSTAQPSVAHAVKLNTNKILDLEEEDLLL